VSGTVKEILVKEGDKIKVGQIVFTADNKGTSAAAARETPRQKDPEQEATPTPQREQPTSADAAATQSLKAEPVAQSPSASQPTRQRTRSTDTPAAGDSACRNSEKTFHKATSCA